MDSLNIVTALRGLIKNQISEVHTSLPVRVTGVDYDAKTVVLESVVKNTKTQKTRSTILPFTMCQWQSTEEEQDEFLFPRKLEMLEF